MGVGSGSGSPKDGYKKLLPPGMPGKPSVMKSEKSSSPKNSSDVGPNQPKSGGGSLNPKYSE